MLEILMVLQALCGLAVLVLMVLVGWLLALQRRGVARSHHSVEEVEIFLHEFSMATETLIERYERQREKLEELARRTERLVEGMEREHREMREFVHEVTNRLHDAEQYVAELTLVGPNAPPRSERSTRLSLAPAEAELMNKMQRMKGGGER